MTESDKPATREAEVLKIFIERVGGACPLCGYDLAGLQSDRCPECGEHLRLRIGLVEPRLGMWIAGLVALAGGTGTWVFLSGLWVSIVIAFSSADWLREFLAILGAMVASAVPLAFWIVRRRWIMGRKRGTRWLLASSAWAWIVLIIAVMFALGFL